MDMRNNLFGKSPRGGMPGRPQQGGGGGPPGGYSQGGPPPGRDDYGGRQHAPPPQQRSSGGYQGGGQQGYGGQQGGGGGRSIPLRIDKLPKGGLADQYIFGNLCAVSPNDFRSRDGGDVYIMLKGPQLRGEYVVTARPTPGFPDGCISLSDPQRQWCGIGMMDTFTGEQYDPFSHGDQVYLGTVDLEIAFASQRRMSDQPYDQDELADIMVQHYQNQMFSPGQRFLMDNKGVPLSLSVKAIQLRDLSMEKEDAGGATTTNPNARGILTNISIINFFKDASSPIKLKGSSRRPAASAILRPDFKFEDMGIGGLDKEFSTIFRRAFTSRLMPAALMEKSGLPHVKGLLLYGPPGTGKTLIARQIGKMLNAREPKIINGPEVLNKFVGQSEENVRKIFADAEKEYKEKGEESGLHIIIFDELDAVCKQRGSGAGGGTGVGDSIVNQLLTKLDGVEQLNNILLIGMTNRKDMIDEALLRPGRLEIHVEISLPDEQGRQEILKIHTKKLLTNGLLGKDVDIKDLAARTKNFSGAELIGLVKAATSTAFNEHVKVGEGVSVSPDAMKNVLVTMTHFETALEDIKPAFGVSEAALEEAAMHGIIQYSPNITKIQNDAQDFARQVAKSAKTPVFSVLLYGPSGSGTTALAADLGLASGFPFVKLVSGEDMVGMHEQGKIEYLRRVFNDAYKSKTSIVILDCIERIIGWVQIGPRFQAEVLSAMAILMKAKPPKGRRILVVGTTSNRGVLQQLNVLDFERELAVPAVSDHAQLASLLWQTGQFTDQNEINSAMYELQNATGTTRVDLGVKKVLSTLEGAVAAGDGTPGSVGALFVERLSELIVSR